MTGRVAAIAAAVIAIVATFAGLALTVGQPPAVPDNPIGATISTVAHSRPDLITGYTLQPDGRVKGTTMVWLPGYQSFGGGSVNIMQAVLDFNPWTEAHTVSVVVGSEQSVPAILRCDGRTCVTVAPQVINQVGCGGSVWSHTCIVFPLTAGTTTMMYVTHGLQMGPGNRILGTNQGFDAVYNYLVYPQPTAGQPVAGTCTCGHNPAAEDYLAGVS